MARCSTTTPRVPLPLLLLGALLCLIAAPKVVVAQSDELDIVFVIDTTKSIGEDLDRFKNVINAIVTEIQGLSPSTKYGLAKFEDYPFASWGQPGDVAYERVIDLTETRADFELAVQGLQAGNGNDEKESQLTAIDQLIGGAGQTISGQTYTIVANQDMSFRSGAEKIICMWTDSMFNSALVTSGYPGASLATVISKLTSTSVNPPYRFVGLNRDGEGGNTEAATTDLRTLAEATGSTAPFSVDCNSDVTIASGGLLVCTKVGGSEAAIQQGFVEILEAAANIGATTVPGVDDFCNFGAFNVFCELFNTIFGFIEGLITGILNFFIPP